MTIPAINGRGAYDRINETINRLQAAGVSVDEWMRRPFNATPDDVIRNHMTDREFDPLPRMVSPELCPSDFGKINNLSHSARRDFIPTEAADREQRHDGRRPDSVPLPSSWERYAWPLMLLTLGAMFIAAGFVTDSRLFAIPSAFCIAIATTCFVVARGNPHRT